MRFNRFINIGVSRHFIGVSRYFIGVSKHFVCVSRHYKLASTKLSAAGAFFRQTKHVSEEHMPVGKYIGNNRINIDINIRMNRTFSRQNPDSGHYKFASTKLSAAVGEKTRS